MLLCLLGVTLFPLLTRAQDSFHWKTNYYLVTGATVREIRHSMNVSRPWKSSAPTDAETRWQISWHFNTATSNDSCRTTSFRTTTTATMTLPRWIAPTNAPPDVRAAWQRYLAALVQHEVGHVQFARAAAAEMHKQVKALGNQADCESLKRAVHNQAQAVLQDYRKREQEFDQRTRHGATQGAHFP